MTFPTNQGLIDPPKPNAARNEQLKIIATYLNGIAVALVTVGILVPSFAAAYAIETVATDYDRMLPGFVICAIGSLALHLVAVWTLKGIRP